MYFKRIKNSIKVTEMDINIAQNLEAIKTQLPEGVELVVISKTRSHQEIMQAYDSGHRVFGENKVQELAPKWEALPKDIEWHMVGHLQRNKVKYMAEFVSLIHAVDSLRLLREINKQAKKHDRVINCLLQMKIAQEESKYGITLDEIETILKSEDYKQMKNVRVVGLMGMATFTEDQEKIKAEFNSLHQAFNQLKQVHELRILSMGMSGDYELAIECGSNMVRIGSSIFGPREYQ